MYKTKSLMTFNDILNDFNEINKCGYYNSKIQYDTYEHENDYFLEMMLPGFEKENIKIDYDDRKITLKAERKPNDDYEYHKKGSFFGKIVETFTLSFEPEVINAEFNDGVLTLKIEKKKTKNPIIKFK